MNEKKINDIFKIRQTNSGNAICLRHDNWAKNLTPGQNPKMWFRVPGTVGFLAIVHVDKAGKIPSRIISRMQSYYYFDESRELIECLKHATAACGSRNLHWQETYDSEEDKKHEQVFRFKFECLVEASQEFPMSEKEAAASLEPFFKYALLDFCQIVEWVIAR